MLATQARCTSKSGWSGNRAKAAFAIASASSSRPLSHSTWIGQICPSGRSGECSRSSRHRRNASSASRRLIADQASPAKSSGLTKGYSIVPSTALS
jgi:hypothetical protein